MRDRADWPVTIAKLGEEVDAGYLPHLTPEERMEATWKLTLDAWAARGVTGEQRLQRDVVRILKRRR